MRKFTFLAATAVFFAFTANAQVANDEMGYFNCGSNQAIAAVFQNHPDLQAQYEQNEADAEAQDLIDFQNGYHDNSRSMPPVYIIPIVFHIIHTYGSENISDAQVLDEMNILNRDYRKLNADTTQIVNGFIPSDAEIEFRLPSIDPNGNCTNGIDHVYSALTNNADDNSKINYWPRNKYLNIWVVKSIGSAGVAGYAYLPGTAPSASTDGVLILNGYIGSIGTSQPSHSRALTHEIGHFLNLQHTWGNTNNPGVACGNDGVTDTPTTKGYTSCALTNNMICTANVHENVQNYMEYSYCSVMFTAGQRTRMRNALNSGTGQRSSLWTTSNLTATGAGVVTLCAPVADFTPYAKVFVCAGGSVSFNDISTNGQPTSWNWSFPGGTPSTSTDSMPVIQYNTPGVYQVSLTSGNSAGSNTVTRTNHVYVSSTTAQYNNWQYYEPFESSTQFTSDWVVVNPQGNGWSRTTTAAYNGTGSCRILNSSGMVGQVDELVSPSIDMSAITGGPQLTFKVAFAQRTASDADRLRVLVSTDCGQTWTQRYLSSGAGLATVSATSSSFVPTSASQWTTETVNISSFASQNNFRIKFEFTSDGGNNIYIDDINIVGTNGINAYDAGVEQFNVVPNPANDNTNVSFSLMTSQKTVVEMYDMTGRMVKSIYNGDLAAGTHTIPVNTSDLNSGMYFVRITTKEGRGATQKLIIE